MKMLHECRATHVLWVVREAEIDGGIHFQVWPEVRSMSGQTRSNKVKFSNSIISSKTWLSCLLLSQDAKNAIYFYVRLLEMPKIVSQKSDVITFTRFFYHCIAKNKDIAFKFGMCIVYCL